MAAHRMARGRKRADEILAFDPARRHAHRRSRRHGQLRWRIERDYEELKSELGLAISKVEAGADSITTPSSASPPTVFSSANERRFPPRAPGSAKCLAYPCVPNPEARQSDPNDMSKIRSPRSEDNSQSRSPAPSCAAHVAKLCHHDDPIRDHRDTVEFRRVLINSVQKARLAECPLRSEGVAAK